MKNKYDVAKLFTLLLVVFAYSSKMLTDQAAIDNFPDFVTFQRSK